jgi:hypothetical protein
MIGVLLQVWILPLRKLVLSRLLSVSPTVPPLGGLLFYFHRQMEVKSYTNGADDAGLQGQTSAAVINEMRDSLIDHYA